MSRSTSIPAGGNVTFVQTHIAHEIAKAIASIHILKLQPVEAAAFGRIHITRDFNGLR
ncbi:MAG: hypothetical protein AB7K35_07260 [Pseudorhodoplanes sp.]